MFKFVGFFAIIMAWMIFPAVADDANVTKAGAQITPAPAVPTVPIGQPFKLRLGEVYDLPSGEMLSFRFASNSGERIGIIAGSERSKDLARGEFFTPSNGCQIDYIDFDRSDRETETATLRVTKC